MVSNTVWAKAGPTDVLNKSRSMLVRNYLVPRSLCGEGGPLGTGVPGS